MSEARSRDQWSHTADLECLIANAHRNGTDHPTPFTHADFNPWLEKTEKVTLSKEEQKVALKAAFVKE